MPDRLKMLLVDDNNADARLIIEIFKDEQIEIDVDVARDGEAAMEYLRREGVFKDKRIPDIVLLDLNMPKKDGREVLADIKADPELKSIPVVILTTSQLEEDVIKCYELQASCYIEKPIDLENFILTMKSMNSFWFNAVRFPPRQGYVHLRSPSRR